MGLKVKLEAHLYLAGLGIFPDFKCRSFPCSRQRSTGTWRLPGFSPSKSGTGSWWRVTIAFLFAELKKSPTEPLLTRPNLRGEFLIVFPRSKKWLDLFGHLNISDPCRSKRDAIHRGLHILWIHLPQWVAQTRKGSPCPTKIYKPYLYFDYFPPKLPQEQYPRILLFSYFWSLRTKTSLYRQIHKHYVITNGRHLYLQINLSLHST